MGVYLTLPPIILFLGTITNIYLKQYCSRKVFLVCAFIILFLLMGLRDITVGRDNYNYTNQFYMIGQVPFREAITEIIPSAPIYCLYNRLLYIIYPQAIFFSICNALIICICTAIFFYRFSNNIVCSVYCYITLYLYLSSFNITRQYIAVSLTLLAACLIDKRKILNATIVMLLAIGIHNTALIMLPIIPLLRVKFTPKIALINVFSCILFFITADPLIRYIIKIFAQIFPRYQMYLGKSELSVFDIGKGDNIYLKLFYLCFIVVAYCILIKNRKTVDPLPEEVSKLLLIVSIGLIIGMSNAANLALSRFFKYFEVYLCCFIPNIIELFGKKKFLIYYWCYILLWFPYLICLSRNFDGVVPYSLI